MGGDLTPSGVRKLLKDEEYPPPPPVGGLGEASLRCIRCALCSYTCPVYRELLVETEAPRGRVALIRAVAEGQLEPGERYAQKIYHCLQCGACTTFCPSKVEVDKLMEATRAQLVEKGLLPPSLVQLGETITTRGNVSGDDNSRRLVWTENLEHAPSGVAAAGIVEVVYFVGCVSSFFPASYGIPQAFVEILEAAGVVYALLGGKEWCCGYPLFISGQDGDTEVLIAHNIARVRALGASRVVASCASCYHAWKHIYPKVGGGFGVEVLHTTEFLLELIKTGRLRLKEFPEVVTYHDPCDLGRKGGIFDPPRQILKSIPGLTLVEMINNRQNSRCCGGGGNLETLDRPLTEAIAKWRINQALNTGAKYLITACPQCKRTLAAAAKRKKARLRVLDITELVAKLVEREDPH